MFNSVIFLIAFVAIVMLSGAYVISKIRKESKKFLQEKEIALTDAYIGLSLTKLKIRDKVRQGVLDPMRGYLLIKEVDVVLKKVNADLTELQIAEL